MGNRTNHNPNANTFNGNGSNHYPSSPSPNGGNGQKMPWGTVNVNTGDATHIFLYLIAAVVSLAVVIFMVRERRN